MANDNIDNAIEKTETICKDNSNLLKKTEYQIPRGIFPNEEDITLCDIKVNSGRDDMGDDAVYKKKCCNSNLHTEGFNYFEKYNYRVSRHMYLRQQKNFTMTTKL